MQSITSKPSLIFLHGICGNKEDAKLLRELNTIYNVYALNLPAHAGESAENIEDLSDIANFVHEKIKSLKLDSFVIVGFSLGGLVALAYAQRYQYDPRLKGIVVWASPILPNIKNTSMISRFNLLLFKLIPTNVFNKFTAGRLAQVLARYSKVKIQNMQKQELAKIVNILHKNTDHNVHNNVKKLFIFGDRDFLIGNKSCAYLQSLQPVNSQIKVICNGGHLCSRKGNNEVVEEIKKFVEDL